MASVEIYIKNYKGPDGTVISTETLLQTIPMTGDPVITNPKVKTDLGKAGSFEFGMELNSPYYDAMMQMKTIMRVVYFGETLFRGRVLTIDKGMARSRVVHCEGDLAFLLDSHQVGVKDDARQKTDVLTYLSSVINQHNSDVDDSDKRFILGEAPSSYSDSVLSDQRVDVPADKAEQKFGSSSYDTSMDRLEGLLSDFGGYMRTRYDPSDGTVFLDWLDNYYHPYSGQDIEVASNLIDLSGQTEVSNLFTIVLPIGKKDNGEVFINSWWPKVSPNHPKVDYIKVSELATIPLYSDEVLNSGYHRKEDYANANARFGKIWKPVEFENANTPQKLFNYAKDWIKNNFMPELTQWDVTALDLKFVGVDTRALFTGDRVKLVHPEVDQTFISVTIISAEYDLYNPDKNKFKIGIPNQQINASYGVKQKNASGAKSVNAGISADNLQKELESKVNSLLDDLNRDRDILQQQYILKTTFGEDIGLDDPWAFLKYETDCVTEKDPETVANETAEANKQIALTMRLKNLPLLAIQRTAELNRWNDPVKPNDPQLIIDNTPALKMKQDLFKGAALVHLVQDLNLPQDQAIVLMNESIEDTNLIGLVDDDGNWTEKALNMGAAVWNPELKKVLKNAELAFEGTSGTSINDNIITNSFPWLVGGSADIGGGTLSVKDIDDTVTGGLKKVVSFIEDKAGIELSDTLENLKTSFNIDGLFNVEDVQNKITNGFSRVAEFLGGVISTKSISDAATGLLDKTVELIGGALTGSSKEKNGDKETALSIINGLLNGSSKEKTGSTDVDKYVDILSGTFTGSEKKTTSTGTGSKVFNFLSGVLTGSETGKESTGESNKLFDVLSGLFSGSKTKASSSAEEITTFFLGNDKAQVDGTTGTASFGDGYEWMVKLNDTVGQTRGFISAKDFQAVQAIPSFKTKFAAVDTFVANQATFNDTYTEKLTAVEAYINKINAGSVTSDTYVSAEHGSFTSVNVANGLTANTVTGNSLKINVAGPNNTTETADLSLCFSSAVSSFKDGVWTLTLYKIGGGSQDVPFDLTATDWYKNQVAGEYNDGWDAAVGVSSIPEIISSSTEKGSMTASWPNKKTVGSNITRGTTEMTFRLEVHQNEAFIRVEGDNDTYKDYAHITHNQYKNGQNATKVKKGTWAGTSITFTTDAPTPNANAAHTLTLSWNNDTGWSWDDDNGYQQKYQIKDGNTVVDTVYATIPDMAVGLTEPGTQRSTWWKTSGTNANKYVVPGTSAAAYLATDTAKDHPLSSLKTGSDIVITPTEAINAGFKIAHDSITLSQTGSSVVRPGSSTTIYPKALSDAADTSPDNITAISAILTAPAATKTDKVILESTDIDNNVSKTGIIVHYSDNSTTNGLQVLIDASAVYSAGIAKGEGQSSTADYSQGYTTGQSNVSAEITGIAYHSKSVSYNSGTLELGADATGSMTKTPQEGDPTVTALSKYDILAIPVTTTPAVLKIGSWSSSTNKISITKNSGGTANVDGEAIAVGVTGVEITVTPGTNTIGTPVHQGNGLYNLSATATVNINGTNASMSNTDSFTATGAINYGKSLVGLYKTYNWTGATGDGNGNHKYEYYIRTAGRTDVNGSTSEDSGYLNPSSAINYGKTLVTVTGASIVANSVVYSPRPVTGTMNVRLSNMSASDNPIQITVNLDDVYSDGLNGGMDYQSTADFEFDLTDGSSVWSGYFDDVDVSNIYQQGVDDREPEMLTIYTYSSDGSLIPTYKYGLILGEIVLVPQDAKFYPNTPITDIVSDEIAESQGCIKFSYGGQTYIIKTSNTVSSATDKPSPSNYGNKIGVYVEDQPVYLSYVEINWLKHGTYSSDIPTYMEPVGDTGQSYNSRFDESYSNIATDSGVSISTFLSALKSGYYGRYANSASLPDGLYQKVNFTAHYSDGASVTYTVEINTYEMEGQQIDYGYAYVYSTANEGRCGFYTTIGGSRSHWVSCNTYVHLEEDPSNPQDDVYVKVKYNNTTGYISKGLLHSTKKDDLGDGYPRRRTSGWADNEYIVGAYISGFTRTGVTVGVKLTSGGRLNSTTLYGSRAEVVTNLGTQYLTDYGPPEGVYSSSSVAIGRSGCRLVLSDTSILTRSYTIKDENA